MVYKVFAQEIHVSTVKVEANSEEDAINRVGAGWGEEVACEYSYTLDPDTWSVKQED